MGSKPASLESFSLVKISVLQADDVVLQALQKLKWSFLGTLKVSSLYNLSFYMLGVRGSMRVAVITREDTNIVYFLCVVRHFIWAGVVCGRRVIDVR